MIGVLKKPAQELLEKADVSINGDRAFDIRLRDDISEEQFFTRVVIGGSVGLGEAYMDGWWECGDIAELICRLIKAGADRGTKGVTGKMMALALKIQNRQTISLSKRVAEIHYDIGTDLYEPMLGRAMAYTCAYWLNAQSLDEAEDAKNDLICRKLGLKPGQRVLDIGSGFGSFPKYAAKKYGVRVVGITISESQIEFSRKYCKDLPVDIQYMDYRHLSRNFAPGYFDHIVSVGMFEHVGPDNYQTYMEQARNVLKEDGLFLLHTIGGIEAGFDPWLSKYMFPGGWIPSMDQIVEAVGTKRLFVIEDVHNIGAHYDPTLCAWNTNAEKVFPELAKSNKLYNERFQRMWHFYLLLCAGTFRARTTQVWQIVLSPHGVPGGYVSVR